MKLINKTILTSLCFLFSFGAFCMDNQQVDQNTDAPVEKKKEKKVGRIARFMNWGNYSELKAAKKAFDKVRTQENLEVYEKALEAYKTNTAKKNEAEKSLDKKNARVERLKIQTEIFGVLKQYVKVEEGAGNDDKSKTSEAGWKKYLPGKKTAYVAGGTCVLVAADGYFNGFKCTKWTGRNCCKRPVLFCASFVPVCCGGQRFKDAYSNFHGIVNTPVVETGNVETPEVKTEKVETPKVAEQKPAEETPEAKVETVKKKEAGSVEVENK